MQVRDIVKLSKILAKQCGSEEQLIAIISARYMALCGAHQWRWKKKEGVINLSKTLDGPNNATQAYFYHSTTANENRLYYVGPWFATSPTDPYGFTHLLDAYIGGKLHIKDVHNKVYRIIGNNTSAADPYLIVDEQQPIISPQQNFKYFTLFKDQYTLPLDVESLESVWMREFDGINVELTAIDLPAHRYGATPGFRDEFTYEPYSYSIFPEDYLPQVTDERWGPTQVFAAIAGAMDDGPRLAALCYRDRITGDYGPISGIESFNLSTQAIQAKVVEPLSSYNEVCFLVSKTGATYKQFADPSCAEFYVVHTFSLHDTTTTHTFSESDANLGKKYPKYVPGSGRLSMKVWPINPTTITEKPAALRLDYYRAAKPVNSLEDVLIIPPHMVDVLMDGIRADIAAADGNTEGAMFYDKMYRQKVFVAMRRDMEFHISSRQSRIMGTPKNTVNLYKRPTPKF